MGEEAGDVGGGDVGDFLFGEVVAGGEGTKDLTDEGRFVALSTMRDRSHVGTVGLEDDAVKRNWMRGER